MHKQKHHISRRKFLGQASCMALGSTTLYSTIMNLGMINTVSARPHIIGSSDYKAMVCILLAGGADSHNILVPTESSEYMDYATTRGDLALALTGDAPELLPLNYSDNGRTFAVNSAMPEVQTLFNNGDLSFVSNIGTLVEPIANDTEYQSGLKKLPLGLYSHSDQIMQWQTSVPQSRTAVGFAGRMADILRDMNTIPEISMNISFSGKNVFQNGQTVSELSLRPGANQYNVGFSDFPSWWSNSGELSAAKEKTVESFMEQTYQDAFKNTYADIAKGSIRSAEYLKTAFARISPLNTTFSDHYLSQSMKTIAEMISVRTHLGSNRQIFFVTFGGWDHHDDVKQNQSNMLPILSKALSELNDALVEINMKQDVIAFTTSDFGRTLTTNGNGSDHAWGGNTMIMGGPINGGNIFGNYPSLRIENNPLNVSQRGRLIPTTSVDEFYAELALWFGASPNDLEYILPNLCNFYSPDNCPAPLPDNYMPIGMITTP